MKLGYVIIYVPDIAKAVAFYETAFGLAARFIHDSGHYAEMETGGTALAFASETLVGETCHGFTVNRRSASPAGAEVGFVTDDVPAAFARAVTAGAVSTVEPMTKPWGQVVSYVRDQDGFLVEICSAVG